MKIFITSIIILLSLFSLRGTLAETEILETENKDAGWFEQNFKDRLFSLTLDGDTVHFRFKEVGAGFVTEEGFGFEFGLEEGQPFRSAPDHHGSTKYFLKEIGPDGITIQYESEFDHRSFGPDKITIDRGTFRLPYINPAE